jgi:hypothetical protein
MPRETLSGKSGLIDNVLAGLRTFRQGSSRQE